MRSVLKEKQRKIKSFISYCIYQSSNKFTVSLNRSQLYASAGENFKTIEAYDCILLGCGWWYSTFSGFGTIALICMFKSQLNTHITTKIIYSLLWMELPKDVFMTGNYELRFPGFPLRAVHCKKCWIGHFSPWKFDFFLCVCVILI